MHELPFEVADEFSITYAAHTASCTFLLDSNGICRRIVMKQGKRRDGAKNAAQCVGAQYVATLDPNVPGCLVEMPKLGAPMLFARIDDNGRIALVRTGVVTSFETKRPDDPDPFKESVGVMTSAPSAEELQTPRVRYEQRDLDAAAAAPVTRDPYGDVMERTQRIPSVRSNELDPQLLATDEYESEPHTVAPRTTWPSAAPPARAPRTLHDPCVALSPVEDPDDPYVGGAYARTREARASEPVPRRAAVVRRRREG